MPSDSLRSRILGLLLGAACSTAAGCQTEDPTVYRGETVELACASCHTHDHLGAANPVHTAASYPLTCELCHTKSAWRPAAFNNHDSRFPITSGKHQGIACATCHIDPAAAAAFSCMSSGCHSKAKMDDKHAGEVPGYQFAAKACYSCHPDGKEPD